MIEDLQLADTIGKIDSVVEELQYKIEVLEEAVAKLSAYVIEGENNA